MTVFAGGKCLGVQPYQFLCDTNHALAEMQCAVVEALHGVWDGSREHSNQVWTSMVRFSTI
jgi:hypothetical protein